MLVKCYYISFTDIITILDNDNNILQKLRDIALFKLINMQMHTWTFNNQVMVIMQYLNKKFQTKVGKKPKDSAELHQWMEKYFERKNKNQNAETEADDENKKHQDSSYLQKKKTLKDHIERGIKSGILSAVLPFEPTQPAEKLLIKRPTDHDDIARLNQLIGVDKLVPTEFDGKIEIPEFHAKRHFIIEPEPEHMFAMKKKTEKTEILKRPLPSFKINSNYFQMRKTSKSQLTEPKAQGGGFELMDYPSTNRRLTNLATMDSPHNNNQTRGLNLNIHEPEFSRTGHDSQNSDSSESSSPFDSPFARKFATKKITLKTKVKEDTEIMMVEEKEVDLKDGDAQIAIEKAKSKRSINLCEDTPLSEVHNLIGGYFNLDIGTIREIVGNKAKQSMGEFSPQNDQKPEFAEFLVQYFESKDLNELAIEHINKIHDHFLELQESNAFGDEHVLDKNIKKLMLEADESNLSMDCTVNYLPGTNFEGMALNESTESDYLEAHKDDALGRITHDPKLYVLFLEVVFLL